MKNHSLEGELLNSNPVSKFDKALDGSYSELVDNERLKIFVISSIDFLIV